MWYLASCMQQMRSLVAVAVAGVCRMVRRRVTLHL